MKECLIIPKNEAICWLLEVSGVKTCPHEWKSEKELFSF